MLRNLWFGSLMLLVGFELLGKSMDQIKKVIELKTILAGRAADEEQDMDCEEYEA